MPVWDFICPRCRVIHMSYFTTYEASERAEVWCPNPNCQPKSLATCRMVKQVSAPAFIVKGFSAKNGYAKERIPGDLATTCTEYKEPDSKHWVKTKR